MKSSFFTTTKIYITYSKVESWKRIVCSYQNYESLFAIKVYGLITAKNFDASRTCRIMLHHSESHLTV